MAIFRHVQHPKDESAKVKPNKGQSLNSIRLSQIEIALSAADIQTNKSYQR